MALKLGISKKWQKYLIPVAVLGVGIAIGAYYYKNKRNFSYFSNQGGGGANPVTGGLSLSPDVPSANCMPVGSQTGAGFNGQSPCGAGFATYANPSGGNQYGCGQTCADARADYCQRFGVGGVCHDAVTGQVEADQGLPSQGAIISGQIPQQYQPSSDTTAGWGGIEQWASSQIMPPSPQQYPNAQQIYNQPPGYGYGGSFPAGGYGSPGYYGGYGYPQQQQQQQYYGGYGGYGGYGYPQQQYGGYYPQQYQQQQQQPYYGGYPGYGGGYGYSYPYY
jgi:hypothetical protein